ncbi:MAG TPA: nucleoside-diphosphate sugar epimerase/dehydratase [Synergistaceae bacterium]|nr:nucleoside-diphosphate sugar epimerase/dehydratase [Synergistaceae bacterium]HQH78111.1 nucleoside-diphosphate sugar epimerase/dehydratase [Synergistaceae bacterium]HQK24492.1 nucleoside-diphosphate sugar epimerase/dehydratase [Synergistaceae bacterium]
MWSKPSAMFSALREAQRRIVTLWLFLARRRVAVLFCDAGALFLAVYLGYALRFTIFFDLTQAGSNFFRALLVFEGTVLGTFWLGGVYRVLWSQASVEEYVHLAGLYVLGVFLFGLADKMIPGFVMPRTSLAIMVVTGLLFVSALRASWRACARPICPPGPRPRRTIIAGAGDAGAMLARELLRHEGDMAPVGFVDDDPQKGRMKVAGLPVLGPLDSLSEVIAREEIQVVLVAMPSAPGHVVRRLLSFTGDASVEVRVLPSLRELAGGTLSVSRLRTCRLEDLLCREPVKLDNDGIGEIIRGKVVLVTGAGGSIGSEICRQILDHAPGELLLLGHGEHSLYCLGEEICRRAKETPMRLLVADVADPVAMAQIFSRYTPAVVFHAAAHKHVPLMEHNAREALRVNALGGWTVARLAGEYGAERVVMISTDKAVNPTNVMGATKRVAELLLQEAQEAYPGTAYMAVRFGNVLGSRGSVVPKFEQQIAAGGPLTVTDPEMRRYFMLIPEAVSLVLQAGSLGRGGELFVLDMGDPVRIVDLAEMIIRLHGLRPGVDIPIVFSGLRPGEKLFEELFYDPKSVSRTSHDKIFFTHLGGLQGAKLSQAVEEGLGGDDPGVREMLGRWVPTFRGTERA